MEAAGRQHLAVVVCHSNEQMVVSSGQEWNNVLFGFCRFLINERHPGRQYWLHQIGL